MGDGPVYTALFQSVRDDRTDAEIAPELVRVAQLAGQPSVRQSTLAAMRAAVAMQAAARGAA